jgi:cytoskeletal protein CcmA (bactofilin family)
VGAKTTIKGDVTGDEDVVVQGRVEGTVDIKQDLTVAEGGTVKAKVKARSVSVSGVLEGDCAVAERVEITASGKLMGNIKAPKVVIAEGAVFRGNSDMSDGGSGR